MATLKRTDSKSLKEAAPPPRECIVCCEPDEAALTKPCRDCEADYCVGCLHDMFTAATTDYSRMPPRCCSLLQLHTVADALEDTEADAYREKFEEWITPSKTYCPAPACSAFISERRIPELPTAQTKASKLQRLFIEDILGKVQQDPSARFFRGEMDITQLEGYTNVVERPIDLGKIQANIDRYENVDSLTSDMQLLASNAASYNGPAHPVSKAAEDLFGRYLRALSVATQRLLDSPPTLAHSSTFACPKCHVAICLSCKHVEHGEMPCDTTSSDHELAMLESFGYRRCPRCKAGVKKMFGCSHMQCVCGAHWCYWCQRSIDECDGACSHRDDESDEAEEYYSEEQLNGEEGDVPTRRVEPPGVPRTVPPSEALPAAANANPNVPRNLDAGGAMRWAQGHLHFGDEPEEDGRTQVWSCKHNFSPYKIPHDDHFDRGDYSSMECNRCFIKVTPRKPSMSMRTLWLRIAGSNKFSSFGRWIRTLDSEDQKGGPPAETAWECRRCRVVACEGCNKKYEVTQRAGD